MVIPWKRKKKYYNYILVNCAKGNKKKSKTCTCFVALIAHCLHPRPFPEYLPVGRVTAETRYQQPADRIDRTWAWAPDLQFFKQEHELLIGSNEYKQRGPTTLCQMTDNCSPWQSPGGCFCLKEQPVGNEKVLLLPNFPFPQSSHT